jgi:hypothetical protein
MLIKQELKKLELQHNIKILYAVESGSRAWGFESKNSDYDIRYIYLNPIDWYLGIDPEKKDSHEKIEGDLDFSGWELRKALRLFRKSNPPLLEWLRSSIVYVENTEVMNEWRNLQQEYFDNKGCIFHYLSMAKGNFNDYLKKDKVKLKRYFYVLRPILCCKYIEEFNSAPPIEFSKLLGYLDSDVRHQVEKLLEIKKSSEEMDEGDRIPIIQDYLQDQIDYFQKYASNLTKNDLSSTLVLDNFFRKTLEQINSRFTTPCF